MKNGETSWVRGGTVLLGITIAAVLLMGIPAGALMQVTYATGSAKATCSATTAVADAYAKGISPSTSATTSLAFTFTGNEADEVQAGSSTSHSDKNGIGPSSGYASARAKNSAGIWSFWSSACNFPTASAENAEGLPAIGCETVTGLGAQSGYDGQIFSALDGFWFVGQSSNGGVVAPAAFPLPDPTILTPNMVTSIAPSDAQPLGISLQATFDAFTDGSGVQNENCETVLG